MVTFDSTTNPTTQVEKIAVQYVSAHISVIPLVLDGSKAPALPKGQPQVYSQRLPTREELHQWFGGRRPHGIGIKCGAVSLGLEVIDFDLAETFYPWSTLIPKELFNKLTIVETPGGWHVQYRCKKIAGNTQLAMWEKPQSLSQRLNGHRECTGLQSIGKGVRIETRGEGGYVVGEGSPLEVHATGLPYVQAWGPRLPNIRAISPEERAVLWHAAGEFHCDSPIESIKVKKIKQELKREMFPDKFKASADDPWVWYDVNGRPDELLVKAGWQSDDGTHWRRPGKSLGASATLGTNQDGIEIFTVFSTSAGELSPAGKNHACYGPFALLAKLEFGGDRTKAASYVRKELMRL